MIDLRSDAPPADVLAAIRNHAGYGRASQVLSALRTRGVLGVRADVADASFRLRTDEGNRRPGAVWAEVRGHVLSAAGGGSRIVARVGLPRAARYLPPLICLALALVFAWWGVQWWAASFWVVGAAALLVRGVLMDRAIAPGSDDDVVHLVERLDHALTMVAPRGPSAAV